MNNQFYRSRVQIFGFRFL